MSLNPIQARVRSGLDRAREKRSRADGPLAARAWKTPRMCYRIRELREEDLGISKIAKQVGVGTATVDRVLDTHAA